MDHPLTRWIVLILLNVPLYLGLGWLIFREWSEFWTCVRYYFTPDFYSMWKGELLQDWWGTLKLGVFMMLCAGAVCGEYHLAFGDPAAPAAEIRASAIR